MTFKETIKSHGKISKAKVSKKLQDLGDSLFKNKWDYIDADDSGTIFDRIKKTSDPKITKRWMELNCQNTEYNKAGVVLAVQQMYHEQRHIQFNLEEWNKTKCPNSIKSVRQTTDIIRRAAVSSFYSAIYAYNYYMCPEEFECEIYGIRKTIEYFEKNPFIDPKEVRTILKDIMLSDDAVHKPELSDYSIESIDDMLEAFEDLKEKAIHEPYALEPRKNGRDCEEFRKTENDMTDAFLTLPEFQSHRTEFYKCKDAVDRDKILEQTIVLAYSDAEDFIPRLRTELENCRKQLSHRLFTPKWKAISASDIKYAQIKNSSDKIFTDAVNEIPVTEKSPETEFADAVNDITEKEKESSLKYH